MTLRIITVFAALLVGAAAQSPKYRAAWSDPEIAHRIDAGIQANRMGWATLRFVDANGKPLTNVHATVDQTRHQFLFGVNLFMLGGFPNDAENRKYEDTIANLFNYGTAPFYWKALEPQPGQLRFGVDSPKVYRRPPPDLAVEYAKRSGITLKGHCLVWDNNTWSFPDWAGSDPAEVDRLLRIRIEKIAVRYRDNFRVWDVVNEVFNRKHFLQVPMPEDFVYRSFETADRVFPEDSLLTLNEASNVWTDFQDETSPFYLLVQNLRLRGTRVSAIGMQLHFFDENWWKRTLDGETMRPLDMYRVLDRYSDFHLPIHITELTFPALVGRPQAEAEQAEVARDYYRLWFSHPSVTAITWWNLVDDTAAPGEDKWRGGLLHRDFSPKPAYTALKKLIQEEWHTRADLDSATASEVRFQGFYGQYTATVTHEGKTRKVGFSVSKGGSNIIRVTL